MTLLTRTMVRLYVALIALMAPHAVAAERVVDATTVGVLGDGQNGAGAFYTFRL